MEIQGSRDLVLCATEVDILVQLKAVLDRYDTVIAQILHKKKLERAQIIQVLN
jgi:hypothetical protein